MTDFEPETPEALGAVIERDRGSLPFALLHGEALVTCAVWGLGASGVVPLDLDTGWEQVVESEQPLVLHDSLCPMTPPEFIAACVRRAVALDTVVVGVRPVTDTVKVVGPDHVVGVTVDRDQLTAVASPVVLPPRVVRELGSEPGSLFAPLVAELAERFGVELVEAPPEAMRVTTPDDVALLEAGVSQPLARG